MTDEQSEINHYLNSEEDDAEWGEAIRPTVRRRLDAVVSVRFTADELEAIRNIAPDGNVSNFIRLATLHVTTEDSSGWRFDVVSNRSVQRENLLIATTAESSSSTVTGMVLANWQPPSVHLELAS